MELIYTKGNFPKIEFVPKEIHFQSLALAKELLSYKNNNLSAKSRQILAEWVYHLENEGLNALHQIVFQYFQKNESMEDKDMVNNCFITTICVWFVANIQYLDFLENYEKKV